MAAPATARATSKPRGPRALSPYNVLLAAASLVAGLLATGAVGEENGIGYGGAVGLVFFAVGGLLLWAVARAAAAEDRSFLVPVVVVAQGLRAVWCLLKHTALAPLYQRYMEWEDATGRHFAAAAQAQAWHDGIGTIRLPSTLREAHMALAQLKSTVLYYLFGPSPLLPEAIVTTATVSMSIAVYLVARSAGLERSMRRLPVLLAAFLPSLVHFHTLDNRDGICAASAAWGLVGLLWIFGSGQSGLPNRARINSHGSKWAGLPLGSPVKPRQIAGLVILVMADLVALFYRPYLGMLLMAGQGLAIPWLIISGNTPLTNVLRAAVVTVFAPLVLWLAAGELKQTYGADFGLQWAVQMYMAGRESALEAGVVGSEYEIPLTASTPAQAILQLPIRILLLLFSPIPVFPGTLRRVMLYPEMWFIYLYVLPRLVTGIRMGLRHHHHWSMVVLLTVAPIIVAYGLKTAVSGEAVRMRTQFLPELFLFAGIGHVVRARRRARMMRAARPCASAL